MAGEPRRVLVMELAGLGDNVHLLPALWLVRRRWPEARLDVMAHAHVAPLFRLTPWVDRVWPYPAAPKPGWRDNLDWARRLRAERFDCVVNTTGSDRSSLLTRATGAPVRIGRRPADGGPPGWRWLFTRVVEQPYYRDPMYLQKWRCLLEAGFAEDPAGPGFHATIDPALRRAQGIGPQDDGMYVHVSPFTTADARELPAMQMAELLTALRERYPALRLVLSCADNARERAKMAALVTRLTSPPWKVLAGTLDVAALAAVIDGAALALAGDTGSLHLAMMCGRPAVAWFRSHRGEREWIPQGSQYRVLVASGGAPDALHGIDNGALLEAIGQVLGTGASP